MLSVIVPVYNAEKYLARCLDSLLNQGVRDYEIICVNDGSTDGCAEILKRFESQNTSQIKVIEKENGGVSSARNAGMLMARGEVVAFCDADDYIAPNAYGYLMRQYWKEGVDVLSFDSVTLDKYVIRKWKEQDEYSASIIYDGDGYGFYQKRMPCFVWSFLYKRSFLLQYNIEFRQLSFSEDVVFNLDVFMHNPHTLHVNANVYRYFVSKGQLTRKRDVTFMHKIVDSYIVMFSVMEEYSKQKPCMEETLRLYKAQQMLPCISRVLSAHYSKKEWKIVRSQFYTLNVLPMRISGVSAHIINCMMLNYPLYLIASVLYRQIFIPFVLPQLKRN